MSGSTLGQALDLFRVFKVPREPAFQGKGNQAELTIHPTGSAANQGESEGWKQGLGRLDGLLSQILKEG